MYNFTPDQFYASIEKTYPVPPTSQVAVDIILKYITSKKHTWTIHLELIMLKFFDFSFAAQNYTSVKEALKNYRSIAQSIASNSLQNVIRYYKKKLQQFFQQKKEQLRLTDQQLVLAEDIEVEEIADDQIEGSFDLQFKRQQDQIRHSMRILWEGFKNIIETVKLNSKLQSIYSQTLQSMFEFVIRYQRKIQFKRFCDVLKNNFQSLLLKTKAESKNIPLLQINKEEQNDSTLSQRFKQLDTALQLQLWFDAFQILEDINTLMKRREKPTKKDTIVKYFYFLSLLFKKSHYSHYYAVSFFYHFQHLHKNDKVQPQLITAKIDQLILAVISIYPLAQKLQSEESRAKIIGLITSSSVLPSKQQLIKLINQKDLPNQATQSIRDIWDYVMTGTNLKELNSKRQILEELKSKRGEGQHQFLLRNILIEIIQKISKVYSKIRLSKLFKMLPFQQQLVLETLLLCQESGSLSIVIDEQNDYLTFLKERSTRLQQSLESAHSINISRTLLSGVQILNPARQFILKQEQFLQERKKQNQGYNEVVKQFVMKLGEEQQRKEKEIRQNEEEGKRRVQKLKDFQDARKEKQKEIRDKCRELTNEINRMRRSKDLKEDNTLKTRSLEQLMEIKQRLQNQAKQKNQKYKRDLFNKQDYLYRAFREKQREMLPELWTEANQKLKLAIENSKTIQKQKLQIAQTLKPIRNQITPLIQKKKDIAKAEYQADYLQFTRSLTTHFKDIVCRQAQLYKQMDQEDKRLREQARLKRQQAQRLNPTIIKELTRATAPVAAVAAPTTKLVRSTGVSQTGSPTKGAQKKQQQVLSLTRGTQPLSVTPTQVRVEKKQQGILRRAQKQPN